MQSAVVLNPVITGVVQHGRKLGRTIGFPTANLSLRGLLHPKFGVYAAVVHLEDGRSFGGAANAGVNPTVGEVAPVLEVFLFDFDEDIYDQVLSVELVAFLRDEAKFDSLATLCNQIHADVAAAKRVLAHHFASRPNRLSENQTGGPEREAFSRAWSEASSARNGV